MTLHSQGGLECKSRYGDSLVAREKALNFFSNSHVIQFAVANPETLRTAIAISMLSALKGECPRKQNTNRSVHPLTIGHITDS